MNYTLTPATEFSHNHVQLVTDAYRSALICLDRDLVTATVDAFRGRADRVFICLEVALDTTKKWTLRHHLGERLRTL